ncbi:EF-hand domain-containing protein [Sedimentitalea todarodis]|uniref:EF-hand domain-containing protein n=1 Tax=Sedimentitalea todarodis TaxID=1631240 RepID=A0ABU3VLQ7_9RHOB|nr:EF-hand domain-containing protein [Sedimentitalea todarodis]MDU9007147.1 EF-hand domain-containing protein [Sedimentitalea todarodis]
MVHKGFIAVIVASSVVLTAGAAMAQKPGGMHRAPISFEDADQDGNGEISKEEFAARHEARFDAADVNSDGALDRDEMLLEGQKRLEERVDALIERFDEDEDGVLSRDEMPKPRDSRRADKFFDRMDQDENGSISKAEYEEAQEHMGKHGKGKWRKN